MIFSKESICADLKKLINIVKFQHKRQKELLEMHS